MDKEYEQFFNLFSASPLRALRHNATMPQASIKNIVDYIEGVNSSGEVYRHFHNYLLRDHAFLQMIVQDQFAFYGYDSFKGLKKYGKGRPYRLSEISQFVWEHYCKVENEWSSSTSPVHRWLQDVGRIIATTRSEEKEFLLINGLEEFCTENYSEAAMLRRFNHEMFVPDFSIQLNTPFVEDVHIGDYVRKTKILDKEGLSRTFALGSMVSARAAYYEYIAREIPPLKSREVLHDKVIRSSLRNVKMGLDPVMGVK